MEKMIFLFLILCISATLADDDQTPKPIPPGGPVKYPEDYCAKLKSSDKFDFIIVGAGPGGAVAARRIAEVAKFSVLLIEAGGDPSEESDIPGNALDLGFDLRWNFTTVESPNFCRGAILNKCAYTPGMALGGSSVLNYMMFTSGNPVDYDEWRDLGNEGWGYEDVLPFFKKLENFVAYPIGPKQTNDTVSEKYHGTGGPLTIALPPRDPKTYQVREAIFKAVESMGLKRNIDVNGEVQIGFTDLPDMVNELGYRQNIAKAYLTNIPDNLKVCKHAIVTKVILKNKVAQGVEVLYPINALIGKIPRLFPPRTLKIMAKKEVILSGGPLNTPGILERSGIGQKRVLRKAGVTQVHELPGVGENFHDQFLNLGVAFTIDFNTQEITNPVSNELTSLTGFVNLTDVTQKVPDVQYILKTWDYRIGLGLLYKPNVQIQYDLAKPDVLLFGPAILRQATRGHVHITQHIDPRITPEINPNQYGSRQDINLQVKATRFARKILKNEALAKFKPKPFLLAQCKPYPFNSEKEIMCMTRHMAVTPYHIVGTCKMGPKSDPEAVVDSRLRVHGIERLRIIDSSVMPLVPRSNTQIPSTMVGEKGAAIVKEDYSSKQ